MMSEICREGPTDLEWGNHTKRVKTATTPVKSARGFLLERFRINRGTILDCSLVKSTLMSRHGVHEGGDPLGLARRGAPVSTSTAVLWADLFCQAGWVTLLQSAISRCWICWDWGFIIFDGRNLLLSHSYKFGTC